MDNDRKKETLEEINKAIVKAQEDIKELEAAKEALGVRDEYRSDRWKEDPLEMLNEHYELEFLSQVFEEYKETGDRDHIVRAVEFIFDSAEKYKDHLLF